MYINIYIKVESHIYTHPHTHIYNCAASSSMGAVQMVPAPLSGLHTVNWLSANCTVS